MAVCEKCKANVEDGMKTCPECGTVIEPQEEKTTSSEQSTSETQKFEQVMQEENFSSKVTKINDTADTTEEFSKMDIEQNKVMAVLAYILFFVPLLAAKDSPFARYHANQGLVLFLCGLICGPVLSLIPVLGWILAPILSIGITVLAIIGIINVVNGKAKELPIIGKFKILK